MKRITRILLTGAVLFTAKYANTQIYIAAQAGYGLPAFKATVGQNYNSTATTTTYEGVYSSLGRGIQPQLIVGYKLNTHFGIEAGYGFCIGSLVETKFEDTSDPLETITGTYSYEARMQRISVGGRITFEEGNFAPYVRGGIVLGMSGKVSYEYLRSSTQSSVTSTYKRTQEFTGGLPVGFMCGVGLDYRLSSRIGLNLEGGLIAQNYAPAHSEITLAELDGQDQLGGMTVRQKETDYLNSVTFGYTAPDDNQPAQQLKDYFPMSSWGFSLGVHIFLGGN